VESLKTLFLAALLAAAAYGVYVTVTGSPPATPPKDAPQDWENPVVELPENSATSEVAMSGSAPSAGAAPEGTPPLGHAPPPFAGGQSAPPGDASAAGYPVADAMDAAPAFAGESPAGGAGRYPSTDPYPSTEPGAGDGSSEAARRYSDDPLGGGAVPARYEEAQQPPPGAGQQSEFAIAWDAALLQLDQDRLAEAHAALSEWFGNPQLTPEQDAQLNELLDQLAGTVIYSRQHLLERPHEVQPGETLDRIAEAYQVPWQLLANINGIRDPQRLRPGEQLKVLRGPFNAVVNLSQYRLTLFLQGRYAGRFRIGIGKDQSTPEGEFVVLQKLSNPTYYGKNEVVDAEDPRNPLGEFALDLGDHILIHGTNDPNSIGRAESRGCIRLDNRDVQDVFQILSAHSDRSDGSKVTIRR
jgi:hypothetical protein